MCKCSTFKGAPTATAMCKFSAFKAHPAATVKPEKCGEGAACLLSLNSVWSNYRAADRMWTATAFSVARGSVQEKSSKLKFDENRGYILHLRLHLSHWISCAWWSAFVQGQCHFCVRFFWYDRPLTFRWGTCLDNLCFWCPARSRGATSSSFQGGQFSWNFIRWRHRAYSTVVQLFANGHI